MKTAFLSYSFLIGFSEVLCQRNIQKPYTDSNKYGSVKLPNGITVFMIEEPSLGECYISLRVNAGHNDDPVDYQGTAHVVENLLPNILIPDQDPDTLSSFVIRQGGEFSSFTTDKSTYFRIKINYTQFFLTAGYLSRTLLRQKFQPVLVKKVLDKINKQYLSQFLLKSKSIEQVFRELSQENSLYRRFGNGNFETLQKGDFNTEISNFMKKNYVGSKIVLGLKCVAMNLLQKTAEIFMTTRTEDSKTAPIETNSAFFSPTNLRKLVYIQPTNPQDPQILFSFAIPASIDVLSYKPFDIIHQMLIDEQAGSIVSHLRRKGYLDDIKSNYKIYSKSQNLFFIELWLTTVGLENHKEVISEVLEELKMLPQKLSTIFLDELAFVSSFKFNYLNKKIEGKALDEIVDNSQNYPIEEVFSGPYVYKNFSPESFKKVISYFTAENLIVFVLHKNKEQLHTIEPIYTTKYSTRSLDSSFMVSSHHNKRDLSIQAVKPNPYIAYLKAFALSGVPASIPVTIQTVMRGLYSNDNGQFGRVTSTRSSLTNQIEARCTLIMKFPESLLTDESNILLLDLWTTVTPKHIKEFIEQIKFAGGTFVLEKTATGFLISISAPTIILYPIFNSLQTELKNYLENGPSQKLFNAQLDLLLAKISRDTHLTTIEKLEEIYPWDILASTQPKKLLDKIKRLNFSIFDTFSKTFLKQVYIEGICTGNIASDLAKNIVSQISGVFGSAGLASGALAKQKVYFPQKKIALLVQNLDIENSENFYQVIFTLENTAEYAAIAYAYSSVATAAIKNAKKMLPLKFKVVSWGGYYGVLVYAQHNLKTSIDLRKETWEALNYIYTAIDGISSTDFENKKTEAANYSRMWLESDHEVHQFIVENFLQNVKIFDSRAQLTNYLKNLTQSNLKSYIYKYFMNSPSTVELFGANPSSYNSIWKDLTELSQSGQNIAALFLKDQLSLHGKFI